MVRSALSIEMRVSRAAASREAAANWDSGFTVVTVALWRAVGGVFVRRNNSILGSAGPPAKQNLVQCTNELQAHRIMCLKCNKMKHLTSFPKRPPRLRT